MFVVTAKKCLVIVFLLWNQPLCKGSVSIVYSLKIAETTKRQAFEKNGEHPSLVALTPFNQFRTKYSGERHNYGGNLFSYIYSPEEYFVRVDWACAQVNADHGLFKKTQTDDVLFSGGYSFAPNQRSKCGISGMLGFPTHKDISVLEPQFGYSQIGLGGQVDGSFIFSEEHPEHSFRCAFRALHFFKRPVYLHGKRYLFSRGNLIDLYVAMHITMAQSRIDIGYNPTFLSGAAITPSLSNAVEKTDYKRNSFFAVYKYKFKIGSNPSAVLVAISYAFDFEPRDFGNKRIITAWASWSVGF